MTWAFKVGIVLIVCGLVLLAVSLTMTAYTDDELYETKYMELESGQSDEFYALRHEMLTLKYRFEDYAVTAIVLGITAIAILRRGFRSIQTPKSRLRVVFLGVVATAVTFILPIVDLFHEYARGEYPHWADSLGIPLSGAVFMIIPLSIWMVGHLTFLLGPFSTGGTLGDVSWRNINPWLIVLTCLTLVVGLVCAFTGLFWFLTPAILYSYFYLSLLIGRASAQAR